MLQHDTLAVPVPETHFAALMEHQCFMRDIENNQNSQTSVAKMLTTGMLT